MTYFSSYYQKHREERLAQSREYYQAHKDEIKDRTHDYYLKNRERLLAIQRAYRLSHIDEIVAKVREWRHGHGSYIRAYRKQRVSELKAKAYLILGNRCARCGFEDVRAIQVDHINGGGGRERHSLGHYGIYLYVIKNPELARKKYQLLCANCNVIKSVERGERPYRRDAV